MNDTRHPPTATSHAGQLRPAAAVWPGALTADGDCVYVTLRSATIVIFRSFSHTREFRATFTGETRLVGAENSNQKFLIAHNRV